MATFIGWSEWSSSLQASIIKPPCCRCTQDCIVSWLQLITSSRPLEAAALVTCWRPGRGRGRGPPAAWADGCWPPCVWTLLTYFTRYVEFCVKKVQMVVSELYLETTWTITVTVDYIAIDLLQLLHWIKEPFHSPGIGAVGPGHHDGNITHCNLAPWWGHLGKWDPLT